MFTKKDTPINLLELVPRRQCEYDIDEDGRVTVKIPRFKHNWMKNLVPSWKSPYIRTKLDEVGSFVWKQCDGKTAVHDIGERMLEEFGEEIEPVYERLKVFFKQLGQRGYVTLHHADGTQVGK